MLRFQAETLDRNQYSVLADTENPDIGIRTQKFGSGSEVTDVYSRLNVQLHLLA